MGKILILAAYIVYAVFWTRFFMHGLVWMRATERNIPGVSPGAGPGIKACALTVLDVLFLGRVLVVNPALWLGEWVFHASFLLVVFRHLRYFLDPVPAWVWWMQTPGLIAGYVLPLSLAYILVIRLLTKHERYASRANMLLLALVLVISLVGVVMHAAYRPNLVDVKLFILGIMSFAPAPAPESLLFALHFALVLALILLVPTHMVAAPLVMYEARKRDEALKQVMHEKQDESEHGRLRGTRF